MRLAPDVSARRWWVLASAMASFFAVGMAFFAVPALIAPLRAAFGLSNLAIGVLMGAIAAPAIVLSIPFGSALDRWPPRAAGLAGLAAMLAGAVGFAAAPSYAWLLAARLLFGAGALLMNLLLARTLSIAFAGRELALAMALFTGTYAASMIILFSLHPWLEARVGWRGEMGLLATLVLAAIPLHAFAMPARLPSAALPGAPRGGPAFPPALVALGVAWMFYFVPFSAVATFAPEWAGTGAAGLLLASVITWVALFGTPIAGGLIDRTRQPVVWCVAGTGLLAATLAAMAAGVLPPLPAMVAIGLVAGAVPPAFYSLPSKLVAAERVGLAFGFITALSNLGTLIGPALAGAVRDATPAWSGVWGSLACAALASAAAAALVRPLARRDERH